MADRHELSIQEACDAFIRENPYVWELFVVFATELLAAGKTRYGAKSIFERIRWHYAVHERGDDFCLNNNFTSRFARKLMSEDERFGNFFEIRKLKEPRAVRGATRSDNGG